MGGARAWLSAAMLAGFLVVATAQLALVVVPVLLVLSLLPSGAALRLGVPLCIATVGVMAYATWRALRTRRIEPAGVEVTRSDAPALWAMIDAAAQAGQVRSPERVIVVAEATVVLSERTHLLGLIGGRQDLYLGLPLLQAWDNAVLGAAVAHELSHVTPRLSRWAPPAYRGRRAVARIIPRISRRNGAGPVLRAYAKIYRGYDQPVSQAQELCADWVAAEFAGVAATVAMLRDGPAMETLQRVFYTEYVAPGWRTGHAPDDVFGGFLRMLAARADELTILRRQELHVADEWDTHPPRPERLAAVTALATPIPIPAAPAPAMAAPAPATVATAPAIPPVEAGAELSDAATPMGAGLSDAATPTGAGLSHATGPAEGGFSASSGLTDAAANSSAPVDRGQEAADGSPISAVPAPGGGEVPVSSIPGWTPLPVRAGAGALVDVEPTGAVLIADDVELVPDLPGLGRALQAVAFPPQGRTVVGWDEFFGNARAAEMDREADAALGTLTRAAGTPVASAADVLDLAADGRLRKVAETVFPDMPPDETERRINELVTLLLALAALRSGAARWRHSWTGTAELVASDGSHLDLGAVATLVADPSTVAAARDRLIALRIDPAATAGAERDRRTGADVVGGLVNLVVDGSRTDLLIVDTGLLLVPGLPRSQNSSAKRRLAQVAAMPNAAPGARFVPYAEVSGATQTRRTPKAYDLRLRDGNTLTVRAALDSDELPGGWAALDDAVAYLARTR
ncbi:M48 family metallopeptidase [Actinoplanes sp. NPDC049265]|uniref:M48 family metallopeptidase n=1 Tax=Actinoplanes sp. NPDC049265 TaxID=3363902 RepID=UPI003713B446